MEVEEVESIHKVPLVESEPENAQKPKEEEEEQVATVKPEQISDDDVFGEGSDRNNSAITEEEAVRVKEEVDDDDADGDDRGVNTPPFLNKTFEMVDDPESDPIVSWSATRDSFVVWDSHEFSKILLPKYFKHSNFSSFIRQLNTYGFRKVDSDRWEFANEGFQGGKKHLLKNIKSRRKYNKLHQGSFNSMKPCLEDEVEKLKKDQNLLKVEILKLRQQHENSQIQLTNVQERVRCAELKQYPMLIFLTRMVKKPTFVEQLIQKIKRKGELDGVDMVKRRRLLGTQCPVSFPKALDTTPIVDYRPQGSEQLATLQSELNGLLSETLHTSKMEPPAPSPMEDELCSSIQGLRAIGSMASAHDVATAYDVMSEKLMGESSVVDEEVYVNDSNIYLELEDLISQPIGLDPQVDWWDKVAESD